MLVDIRKLPERIPSNWVWALRRYENRNSRAITRSHALHRAFTISSETPSFCAASTSRNSPPPRQSFTLLFIFYNSVRPVTRFPGVSRRDYYYSQYHRSPISNSVVRNRGISILPAVRSVFIARLPCRSFVSLEIFNLDLAKILCPDWAKVFVCVCVCILLF